ncbi:MAG: LysE family translocator [Ignavibacteriales bacterium]
MIYKGFKFGILLQIAIGPVFIYIFKTATEYGLLASESGVLAATLIDAVYVLLAIVGIGSVLDKPGVKKTLKYFGAIILVYFGFGIILGTFEINIIPSFKNLSNTSLAANSFLATLILTASNPLTILFWTGVFASRITCEGYSKKEMKLFGIGAVLATFIFLGSFAFIASLFHVIITETIINILNIVVGIFLIGFGIRMCFSKMLSAKESSE